MVLDRSYSAKFQAPRRADDFDNYSALAWLSSLARLLDAGEALRIIAGLGFDACVASGC
jgi:hypothetical protein